MLPFLRLQSQSKSDSRFNFSQFLSTQSRKTAAKAVFGNGSDDNKIYDALLRNSILDSQRYLNRDIANLGSDRSYNHKRTDIIRLVS
jgi:hypothetical protein